MFFYLKKFFSINKWKYLTFVNCCPQSLNLKVCRVFWHWECEPQPFITKRRLTLLRQLIREWEILHEHTTCFEKEITFRGLAGNQLSLDFDPEFSTTLTETFTRYVSFSPLNLPWLCFKVFPSGVSFSEEPHCSVTWWLAHRSLTPPPPCRD